jgi:hypothetical protein
MHRPGVSRRGNAEVCSPSLPGANGSRECAPDDRLHDEASTLALRGLLDCFASARNDGVGRYRLFEN